MSEYNSDFNRLSSTNEIRLNDTNEARQSEALTVDNMELGPGSRSGGIEEVCTVAPVRLVTSDGSHSHRHRHSAAQRNRSGPVSVSRTGSGLGSIRGSGGERGSGEGSGMRVRGPLFYSNNSANAVTLAGDRGRHSNDPCAQQ
jgi:hypothetical protein